MKLSDLKAALGATDQARLAVASLRFSERLPSGLLLEINVAGIPHHSPQIVALDRGHHPAPVSELSADDLGRCEEVRRELDAWWTADGPWPIPRGAAR